MMSRIDSWHWKISTGRHFQNGHHNTAQIQHCPISTPFHMWVDYDVPKAIGRNFSMSVINSGHHYLPTCQILMISENVEFLPSIFYAVFWQTFWKILKRRIAPLMLTYHYVKFYVSIIIHLEVININVRNFNFLVFTMHRVFFIRQYVQPCLSKNPKYTFYTIKSSLTLAYRYSPFFL
jgi:hypothetical protein